MNLDIPENCRAQKVDNLHYLACQRQCENKKSCVTLTVYACLQVGLGGTAWTGTRLAEQFKTTWTG